MKQKLNVFERTRCFQFWHDGSVIVNHGYIVFCCNILYDPAVFYTSSEYTALTGCEVNVQSKVEFPELYLIGRCGSNDEQLGYIKTRLECLADLKVGLNLKDIDEDFENITLNDTMRYFHGDGQACWLESGNQKGGTYFCPSCNISIFRSADISHSYRHKFISIASKQHTVLCGKFGRINSCRMKTYPFDA